MTSMALPRPYAPAASPPGRTSGRGTPRRAVDRRRSVPAPAATTAAFAAVRGGCGRAGDGHLMPHPSGEVEAVALGLPRGAVAHVGVERMPVVGGLHRAI